MENALLTGLGLAAPAGLNAYVPLLIVALTDRFSHVIDLERPYDFLSSTWGIAVLLLLLTVEIVVDKVPGLDHANDLIQSAIRPAAGAILTMATTNDTGTVNPVVAMLLGLLLAGSVHAAKATTRPLVTLGTGGFGNPIVSFAEDIVAALSAIVAIFVPVLALVVLALFVLFLVWAVRRLRRGRPPTPSPAASSSLRR